MKQNRIPRNSMTYGHLEARKVASQNNEEEMYFSINSVEKRIDIWKSVYLDLFHTQK